MGQVGQAEVKRNCVVERSFLWDGTLTDKVVSVMKMFGVDVDRVRRGAITHKCELELRSGDVCYITGASGSGKSVLLNELYELWDAHERLRLGDIALETDKSLVDCIEGDLFESLSALSKAGLSDVFSILNQPGRLSEGQRYRYRLARALISGAKVIFADEFCSNLDRITAAVIAHNIHRFAKRSGRTFILASSHDDLLCDLLPDVVVIKHLTGKTEVVYRDERRGG